MLRAIGAAAARHEDLVTRIPVTCLGLAAALWAMPVGVLAAGDSIEITVTPSGVEDQGAASRDRLERLSRRFDQTERAFRHICVLCGLRAGDPIAPFDPVATLAARASERRPVVTVPALPQGEAPESEGSGR